MMRRVLFVLIMFALTSTVHAKVGHITRGRTMNLPRAAHTATLLSDGRVLIVGGMQRDGVNTASAELYDPESETFSAVAEMTTTRVSHTATLLADGRVLIVGGFSGRTALNSAELYDPDAYSFTATGEMRERRGGFTATRLADGRVLIAGGLPQAKPMPAPNFTTRRQAHSPLLAR